MSTDNFTIRPVTVEEVATAHHLESDGYPPGEAAEYDTMMYRQRNIPSLFLGYFDNSQMIGFINGTRHTGLNQQSMLEHLPEADCACIHSVCVSKSRRREGLATKLLHAFVEASKQEVGITTIALIAHSHYIPLYVKANFVEVGPSPVVHGKDKWIELKMDLRR